MSNRNKGKAKYNLAWLCVLSFTILTYCSTGRNPETKHFPITSFDNFSDTPKLKRKSATLKTFETPAKARTQTNDTLGLKGLKVKDSLDIATSDTTILKNKVDSFSFKISKDTLAGPVVYHADDSMIIDVPGKKLLLYGKVSSINYADNELAAPQIEYDQRTNLVRAFLKKDSSGKVISFVSFNQGDFKSVMDSIVFDMKTGKGITKGTYTQQDQMYIYGEKIKKESPEVFYALNSRFTTCNLDTPHFAFVSHRIKFISKKMAFTGPVHPEFEGVPLPIYLPFGIFPLSQGRHSGFLRPTFTANDQLGIALEGLGYYKILSPIWDIIARGTLYSYGGWMANVNPRYYKRYRYQGNLSFDVQKIKPLDLPSSRTVNVRWTHSMDNKARPGVTFNANVNAGSSKYNSLVPNDPRRNFQNQLQSSITYAKVWKDKPFNISISANHNQNTLTKLININLPDVAFNVNTLYPFRRKEAVGEYKWYENVGVGLNTNARSLTSFYDTAANIVQQISNNFQYGALHTVPITLSLPQLGVFQVSPNISYQEKWYQKKIVQRWNVTSKKLDSTISSGFYSARDMNFGIGTSTRIFGMYTFKKSSRVMAIRHELRPSLSANYKPDFTGGTYYTQQIDTNGNKRRISVYEGSIYGPYGEGQFGGLNFSLDNNVTMKIRSKKDTGESGIKKVSLLDGLRLDGAYNFLADSFKVSILTLSARTNLFDKFNLTANASFDPYLRNQNGKRIDKLTWAKNPLSLGKISSGSVALQSGFKGGDKSKKSPTDDLAALQQNALSNGIPLDEYQQEAAYVRNNPGEFVDFAIPWSIDFSYSLRFDRTYPIANSRYSKLAFNQDINWNASANLTPKWKIGVNGSYNITAKQIGLISMYLSRDLHCWQLAINVSPVGVYRFFNISISPKSPILRDIKVNRTRSFSDF